MIRVILPYHLRNLARIAGDEVVLDLRENATLADALDELEKTYPVLRGTIRDTKTGARRAYVRYFACREDLSHAPPEAELPLAVQSGKEALIIMGAMSGG